MTAPGRSRLPADWVAVAAIAIAALAAYFVVITQYLDVRHHPIVVSDGAGYYAYLPALLLDRDPTFAKFLSGDLHGSTAQTAGFHLLPGSSNVWVDQYPIGEAEMLLPFFGAGHGLARLRGRRADGYSTLEQAAAGAAAPVYLVLGLLALRSVLRRYFSAGVTAAALIVLTFGSNLFHYATFDVFFSHVFSFGVVAGLLWATLRWTDGPSLRWAAVIGGLAGLIAMVRITNVIVLLLIPAALALVVARRRRLPEHLGPQLLTLALAAAVPILPQLLVWRLGTGHWILDTYVGNAYYAAASFDFAHPHLTEVLWGFDPHGILPWAPAVALAFVGLAPFIRQAPVVGLVVLAVFLLQLYLIASWGYWWYGGGFGHRGFVDIYPLLALPLAALLAFWRIRWMRPLLVIVPALGCLVTVDLMLHYWKFEIPFGGISASGYVRLLTTPPW